ncbi:MAG: NUDIX hydrolase [Planctomycetes bacterium]|nr:NUDIX hydrolase [Planctomycetota bacterium]
MRCDRLVDEAGREYVREVVEHPGAAVIAPRLPDGRIVFVRQYRHAVGRWLIELPAGTLEPGEDPMSCAARELSEETGYSAGKLSLLAVVYPSPGVLTEALHLFLASDLGPGAPHRDPGEQMETHVMTREAALAMVRRGEIVDGKTILGVLLLDGGGA